MAQCVLFSEQDWKEIKKISLIRKVRCLSTFPSLSICSFGFTQYAIDLIPQCQGDSCVNAGTFGSGLVPE